MSTNKTVAGGYKYSLPVILLAVGCVTAMSFIVAKIVSNEEASKPEDSISSTVAKPEEMEDSNVQWASREVESGLKQRYAIIDGRAYIMVNGRGASELYEHSKLNYRIDPQALTEEDDRNGILWKASSRIITNISRRYEYTRAAWSCYGVIPIYQNLGDYVDIVKWKDGRIKIKWAMDTLRSPWVSSFSKPSNEDIYRLLKEPSAKDCN